MNETQSATSQYLPNHTAIARGVSPSKHNGQHGQLSELLKKLEVCNKDFREIARDLLEVQEDINELTAEEVDSWDTGRPTQRLIARRQTFNPKPTREQLFASPVATPEQAFALAVILIDKNDAIPDEEKKAARRAFMADYEHYVKVKHTKNVPADAHGREKFIVRLLAYAPSLEKLETLEELTAKAREESTFELSPEEDDMLKGKESGKNLIKAIQEKSYNPSASLQKGLSLILDTWLESRAATQEPGETSPNPSFVEKYKKATILTPRLLVLRAELRKSLLPENHNLSEFADITKIDSRPLGALLGEGNITYPAIKNALNGITNNKLISYLNYSGQAEKIAEVTQILTQMREELADRVSRSAINPHEDKGRK